MSARAGSPNIFARGPHKQLQNISRAGSLPYKCDCFGITYILPNQQIVGKYIIFFIIDKMASGAAFGPQVVVWRPCVMALLKLE